MKQLFQINKARKVLKRPFELQVLVRVICDACQLRTFAPVKIMKI